MADVPVKKSFGNLPGPGPGRPKGMPNKFTMNLKDAILQAAAAAGGDGGLVAYLTTQASKAEPTAFMAMLGKVLPLQVTGSGGGPLQFIDLTKLTHEQLTALEPVLVALARSADPASTDPEGTEET